MFRRRVFTSARWLYAIIVISLGLSCTAAATQISYALQDLGAGQWVCHYTVKNDTLNDSIEQFIIWFEPDLFENLSIVSDPEIGYDWYQDTVEPDPIWLFYGAYRALAWYEGIPPGESETGFAVRFTYLGTGAPGPQEFDIVDPNEYVSLEAGWTTGIYWVDAAAAGNPIQLGTPDEPFEKIQRAINRSVDGFIIDVAPGQYVENINFKGRAVTVRSSEPADWDVVKSTIINGNLVGRCVVFDQGEEPDSILDGFTLIRGRGAEVGNYPEAGGGILCLDSSPTIRRCHINKNGFRGSGCLRPSASHGGGIALIGSCQANIESCFIMDNYARRGGGILIHSDTPEQATSIIRNCTISNNLTGESFDEAYYTYEVDCRDTRPSITNTIIYNDYQRSLIITDPSLVTYSCIKDVYLLETNYPNAQPYDITLDGGNISETPRFVNPGRPPDLVFGGDYICTDFFVSDRHLQLDSPCFNAGDPYYSDGDETDIDGQQRIMGGRIDIGADEIVHTIIVTKPAGGEVWAAESSHVINWLSYGISGTVDISYSTNNGNDWVAVEENVANTGSYLWQLPSVDSNECLVLVSATVEPADIEYENSGMFTIHPSPAGPPVSSRWPTLGADFNRSGLSDDSGPVVGCVKWQFETQGPVYTSATIGVDDRVHLACEDGRIYTINPNTGAEIWVYDPNSPLLSSPTVGSDGSIYVGCNNNKLYAIDKDGDVRWTYTTDSFIYSTPAVADDGKVFVGSQDGSLYALGSDGSELWNFETAGPGQVGGAILASPTIGIDGSVYISGVFESNLYALDPNYGTIRWVHDFGDLVDSNNFEGLPFASPAVGTDGTIYLLLPNPLNLYALSPLDGSIIWSADETQDVQHAMDSHLQGHWEFDGDTSDSSGNGRDGELVGNVSLDTDSTMGQVLKLQGGYMQIPNYKGITGTSPRTVSVWFKTDISGMIISWGEYGNGRKWVIQKKDSSPYSVVVTVGDGFAAIPYYNAINEGWHHVAVVWEDGGAPDLGNIKFYIDSSKAGTLTSGSSVEMDTGSLYEVMIGSSPFNSVEFHGMVDDVRIYDRALTAAEIFGKDPGAYCWQRPAIGPDGTIYVSFDDNYLRAFNPDGSVKWVKRVGMDGGFTLAVDKNSLIYVASEDGSLYVIDSSGALVARFDGGDWLSQPVIGADGTIYVCDVDNNVLAIDRYACEDETVDLHWIADFNSDGSVDFDDLVILAFDWMAYGNSTLPRASDADRDMFVDFGDFAAVAAKWLNEI